jgi:hypothetical protein
MRSSGSRFVAARTKAIIVWSGDSVTSLSRPSAVSRLAGPVFGHTSFAKTSPLAAYTPHAGVGPASATRLLATALEGGAVGAIDADSTTAFGVASGGL